MESGSPSSQLHHEDILPTEKKLKQLSLGRFASIFKKSESHRADTPPWTISSIFKKPKSHRADTQPPSPPPLSLSPLLFLPPPISAEELNQVFLFFWHAYSPVMYTLYKIDIPKCLPLPPTKAAQELEIRNPSPLFPILQLKTGKYPEHMCCVQLSSKLYFLGGEFNINNPYIEENLKMELKSVKRDVFPREVYSFDLAHYNMNSRSLSEVKDSLRFPEKPMNSGKASPLAFVADEKIYVVGSSIETNISDRSELQDLDLKSFAYFEVYDPVAIKWKVLPDSPIRNVNSRWVGHAVVGRNALLVAWQQGKERIHCFDLDTHQWTKYVSVPSYPGNFSGRTEFVENTLYGCYHSTVAAIAPLVEEEAEETDPLVEEEEEAEEENEIEEVGETKEKGEIEEEEETKEEEEIKEKGKTKELQQVLSKKKKKELQQVKSLFKHARLLKHHHLHLVSEEMGMDAIFNVPPQLQSSSSLLHLGSRYFCYVRTGMPPHPIHGNDHAILDDKRRFISIVIFLALRETYKEDSTRLFRAKFLYSAHYVVDTWFPSEGFIEGCFSPGLCCSYTRMKQGEALSTFMPLFSIKFSFSELKEAISNFDSSLMISGGERYDVYKGVLRDTQMAIKVFHPDPVQGLSEYQQELDVLSKLRHPNIVTLIGACPEACAVIYEYLPNGSLEDRLSCKDNSPPLSLQIRIRIAAEICSVLIFLHSCKPNRIIHGDLKPSKIVLDAYFVSKLTGFEISHVFSHDESSKDSKLCRTTEIQGSAGYIDPAFFHTAKITSKSDVYSFGIVLLQLLTGRPIRDIVNMLDGNLRIPLDPLAGDWPVVQAEKLAHLAMRCCADDRSSRPDLFSVWRALEPLRDSCEGSSSFRLGSE